MDWFSKAEHKVTVLVELPESIQKAIGLGKERGRE